MNRQAIFERVWEHLRKQGRAAVKPGTSKCMYRAPQPDGTTLACGIGGLFPDKEYSPVMDGHFRSMRPDASPSSMNVDQLIREFPRVKRFILDLERPDLDRGNSLGFVTDFNPSPNDVDFLQDLQTAHDQAARGSIEDPVEPFLVSLQNQMNKVAKRHALKEVTL